MNSVMLHMQKVVVAGAFVPWALLARRHPALSMCGKLTSLFLTILVVLELSHISHECDSVTMPQIHIRRKLLRTRHGKELPSKSSDLQATARV